jgi:hypothetical protein
MPTSNRVAYVKYIRYLMESAGTKVRGQDESAGTGRKCGDRRDVPPFFAG